MAINNRRLNAILAYLQVSKPEPPNPKSYVSNIIDLQDMMPMVCDILKFEYFYTPGTIIVCDGRSANIKFLIDHFKRKWDYINDKKNDKHIFCLVDPVLGKYNKLQLKFCSKR
jgi:hypothetical protein